MKTETTAMALSMAYRLSHYDLKVDGTAFDLGRYPYLIELFDERARQRTILKGSQMGFTILEILRSIEDARTLPLKGIGYLFPTDNDVLDFSKARFGPIQENEAFRGLFSATDSAGLKQVGKGHIYFRGAGAKGASTKASLSKLKSIPLDQLKLDERDEMQDQRVDTALHRLDGSLWPEVTDLSTPTLPAYGVDLSFQECDQRHWHWHCSLCNGWTCLETTWPDCIAEPREGDPYYLCSQCGKALERSVGEWVAKYPERAGTLEVTHEGLAMTWSGHIGWWVSQLCSPTRSAWDILQSQEASERRGRPREFWNQVLARPYADLEDMLTREILDACLTEVPKQNRAEGPCCMGVDPGTKRTHYWVKQRVTERDSETLSYGWVESFEELSQIAKRFHVETGVIDGMAETHAVRRFVKDHPGWWACQYVRSVRSEYLWDPQQRTVKVGRTEALDASHAKFVDRHEKLPAANETYHELVVPQLCNLARVRKEDEEIGTVRMVWVIVGGLKNDHLKHAHTYATIAEDRTPMAQSVQRARRRDSPHRRRPRSFMAA